MIGFLFRRILQSIVVILGVTLIIFFMSKLIPVGRPGRRSAHAAPRSRSRTSTASMGSTSHLGSVLAVHRGAGRPSEPGLLVPLQPGGQGDHRRAPPKTLTLVGVSTVVALVIAVPLGILQVVRRYKPIDYILTAGSFLFYAMPAFFLGTLLILYFSFDIHLFPVAPPRAARPGRSSPTPVRSCSR